MIVADFGQVLQNVQQTMPYLFQMVTAISYVLGFYYIIGGVGKLKVFAEMRMQSSMTASLKGPLIYIVTGAALIYFPTIMTTTTESFFGDNPNNFMAYQATTQVGSQIIETMVIVIKVIGAIAFIRGWVLLTHLGGQQAQPNAFSKALTHIIGGVMAMNIYLVWTIFQTTLGLQSS